MLGLVPAIMPSDQLRSSAVPTVHRTPVLAWNATSNPPPGSGAMLGLVPAFMPSDQLRFMTLPTVHSEGVLAWNATSSTAGAPALTPLRRIAWYTRELPLNWIVLPLRVNDSTSSRAVWPQSNSSRISAAFDPENRANSLM